MAALMFILIFSIIIGAIAVSVGLPIYLLVTKEERVTRRKHAVGKEGESLVAYAITSVAPSNSRLINDLVLYDKNGKTYQIDHVFINSNGIWLIETKNWSGSIYGDEQDKYWIQKNRRIERRYNPIKQNFGHYYKIKPILGKNIPVNCLVVFVKADISNIQSNYICTLNDLPERLLFNTNGTVSDEEIERYYKKILYFKEKCNITSEEHEQIMKEKRQGLSCAICPNCGGELVKRKGEHGNFYGCKNFPNCKFTIDSIYDYCN